MTKYKPPRTHLFLEIVPASANPSSLEAQRRLEDALLKLARLIGRRMAHEEISKAMAQRPSGEKDKDTQP
jgi:hypothetical protein